MKPRSKAETVSLMRWFALLFFGSLFQVSSPALLQGASNVRLTEVPDYDWWRGCFGTASGNLMGFWDRHGLPNLYLGHAGGGLAPLDSRDENIRSMWASRAGLDDRPRDQPGHDDDYWVDYESTAPDPYLVAARQEHRPDCIGDFIGLNQNKWSNLGGECDGNIDGFSFVYWDKSGDKRVNYVPGPEAGFPAVDIQSGLRAWTQSRGYACNVFTQLTDFNPDVPTGNGFTFDDLKVEIDAGYPVLLFLQRPSEKSRAVGSMTKANPHIHGMLAYGYLIADDGKRYVQYRTSWASGDNVFSEWTGANWQADLPVRGVIGFHPLPRIKNVTHTGQTVTLEWDGPASKLYNPIEDTTVEIHYYVVEQATAIDFKDAVPITDPMTEHTVTITNCCDHSSFFRVRLVRP